MLLRTLKTFTNLTQPYILPYLLTSTIPTYKFTTTPLEPTPKTIHHYIKSHHTIRTLSQKGISSLFPIQQKTYQQIYNGHNVIASDKTGSGKTIAFSLPVIQKMRAQNTFKNVKGIKFVILAPTRELAIQISKEIEDLKHYRSQFRIASFFGGVPVMSNFRDLDRMPDIVVGTPGRIIDLIQRGLLKFQEVRTVCIDEADYMVDIGFKQPIQNILKQIKGNSKHQCQYLCFTATLNNEIALTTKKYMKTPPTIISLSNTTSQTPQQITHRSMVCDKRHKLLVLYSLLKQIQGRVIIFTRTKLDAEVLSRNLEVSNVAIHGDIQQRSRMNRLEKFRRGEARVLVATDVAARGLDISNVELVVNYDYPDKLEAYVHRSGRTGRAGKTGVCLTFFQTQMDRNKFEKQLRRTYKLNIKNQNMKRSLEQYQQIRESVIAQSNYKNLTQSSPPPPPQPQSEQPNSQPLDHQQGTYILFDHKNSLTKSQISKILQQHNINGQLAEINKNQNKFYIFRNFVNSKKSKDNSNVRESNTQFGKDEEIILGLRFGEGKKKFVRKLRRRV